MDRQHIDVEVVQNLINRTVYLLLCLVLIALPFFNELHNGDKWLGLVQYFCLLLYSGNYYL